MNFVKVNSQKHEAASQEVDYLMLILNYRNLCLNKLVFEEYQYRTVELTKSFLM